LSYLAGVPREATEFGHGAPPGAARQSERARRRPVRRRISKAPWRCSTQAPSKINSPLA